MATDKKYRLLDDQFSIEDVGSTLLDQMPYRFLCNDAQREGAKPSSGLASRLFCYVPLHNFWNGIVQLSPIGNTEFDSKTDSKADDEQQPPTNIGVYSNRSTSTSRTIANTSEQRKRPFPTSGNSGTAIARTSIYHKKNRNYLS